jgi:hypothetical protein
VVQIVVNCAPKNINPAVNLFMLTDEFPVVFRPIEKRSVLDPTRMTLSGCRSEDVCLAMAQLAPMESWHFHPVPWTMGPDPLMDMIVDAISPEWNPPPAHRARRVAVPEFVPADLLTSPSNPFEAGAASAVPQRVGGGGGVRVDRHDPAEADEAAHLGVDNFDEAPGLAAWPDGDDSGDERPVDPNEGLLDDVREIVEEAAVFGDGLEILEEGGAEIDSLRATRLGHWDRAGGRLGRPEHVSAMW